MRTRGWQGDLPRDEEEARTRILAAATRCVDRHGADKIRLADVATELGVTRQTVYRYFPSVNNMLGAVGEAGLTDFLDRMATDLSDVTTAEDAITEATIYCLHALPTEPSLGLLLRAGETEFFAQGATSSRAVSLGADMLRRFDVDWGSYGLDQDAIHQLAELLMRLCLSFLQYPTSLTSSDDELRAFLRTWICRSLPTQQQVRAR